MSQPAPKPNDSKLHEFNPIPCVSGECPGMMFENRYKSTSTHVAVYCNTCGWEECTRRQKPASGPFRCRNCKIDFYGDPAQLCFKCAKIDDASEHLYVQGKEQAKRQENIIASLVDHPAHYNTGSIEVIDAIEAWGLGFHLGNVVKYIARCEHKGKLVEDLEKARWYLDRALRQAIEERDK